MGSPPRRGGRDPAFGPIPAPDDAAGWLEVHLKVSQNLRRLFGASGSSDGCPADREARAALLELNFKALEQLDVAELRAAQAAAQAARAVAVPLQCQESGDLKRSALERLWEEYHFGPLVEEAYPSDACGLQGVS